MARIDGRSPGKNEDRRMKKKIYKDELYSTKNKE